MAVQLHCARIDMVKVVATAVMIMVVVRSGGGSSTRAVLVVVWGRILNSGGKNCIDGSGEA